MKICNKCKNHKDFKEFGKNSSSKDGYSYYCKLCKSNTDKEYYSNNSLSVKNRVSDYRAKNEEKVKQQKKKEYEKNKDKYLERSTKYYRQNKELILANNKRKRKETSFEFYRKRYAKTKLNKRLDPGLKAIMNIRQRVSYFIKGKSKRFSKKLGCNLQQFKDHIESQFKPGMTWENYGQQWELDHKIPLALAWKQGEEQFKLACLYTNLQPLWINDHKLKTKNDVKLIKNTI